MLEDWLRERYFSVPYDLSCSGVESYRLAQIRAMCGLALEELDDVLFNDSPSRGSGPLRGAIAERWFAGNQQSVLVTHGSSEGIFLVMHALLRAGDAVVVAEPIYHALRAVAQSIGCRIKPWPICSDEDVALDLDRLRRLLSPEVRMVVVNFPHNPTGLTLSNEEQSALVGMVREIGAFLVWDDALGDLVPDRARLPQPTALYEKAVSLGTLSKAYGLPGLRLGWLCASPVVIQRCVTLRDYITLSISPLVERIATAVVRNAEVLLRPRWQQACRNLSALEQWIGERGDRVVWRRPAGGVTGFPRLKGVGDVEEFCRRLAAQGTLLVPGTCFGVPSRVRLGFGGSSAAFHRGLAVLDAALQEAA